jgi:hypothetical protein
MSGSSRLAKVASDQLQILPLKCGFSADSAEPPRSVVHVVIFDSNKIPRRHGLVLALARAKKTRLRAAKYAAELAGSEDIIVIILLPLFALAPLTFMCMFPRLNANTGF